MPVNMNTYNVAYKQCIRAVLPAGYVLSKCLDCLSGKHPCSVPISFLAINAHALMLQVKV